MSATSTKPPIDWEVSGPLALRKRFEAEAYRGVNPTLLAAVSANSRLVLWVRMLFAQRRLVRGGAR